jgi:hypothetical protein
MEDTHMNWRKASYTNGGENCVEVANNESVAVRDTKDRGGVTLTVPAEAWAAFLGTLR